MYDVNLNKNFSLSSAEKNQPTWWHGQPVCSIPLGIQITSVPQCDSKSDWVPYSELHIPSSKGGGSTLSAQFTIILGMC